VTALLAQQARTDRAFERIYRRHVGDVYRYALAVLRNTADAEDVTQTTFLNAYRAYAGGERPRNAQNWLIAITHNVCRQRFRQSLRRPEEVEYDDSIGDAVAEDETPTAEDIQRALGQLAFNQRAALVMRELEGRSYAEIAEILGTSVAAVETLIFRARRALREQLEGSLTCGEAERAISREIDGRLSRAEKSVLRGHLRACTECRRFARSQRAQRRAIRALCAIPVPTSLTSLFGGGGAAAVGGGVAAKSAAFIAAGTVATGIGYEGVKRLDAPPPPSAPAAEVSSSSSSRGTPEGSDRVVRAAPAIASAETQRAKPKETRRTTKNLPAVGRTARGLAKKVTTPANSGSSNAKLPKAASPQRRAKPVKAKPVRPAKQHRTASNPTPKPKPKSRKQPLREVPGGQAR
jgi:RNA polymerase sigma factor (sigma-70 family)